MSVDEKAQLADLSLASSLRHFARHAVGGECREEDGVLLFAGGHNYPGAYCNGALRLDATADPASTIEAASDFFAARRSGYVVWIRGDADADLEQEALGRGFFQRPPPEGMPGMVTTEMASPTTPDLPDGARIEAIDDLEAARAYLLVVAEAYGMGDAPPELAAGLLFDPAAAVAENARAILATVDGRPAAGAMAVIVDDVAGLYWVATGTWTRGRGLGAACASRLTRESLEQGVKAVTLQASQMGTRMWRSLGFAEVTRYRRYLAPPSRRG